MTGLWSLRPRRASSLTQGKNLYTLSQRDLVTYTGSLSEEEVEPQFAPRQLGAKSFAF